MTAIIVEVRRYVDDAQPGWVECWLTDAEGRAWAFVEKVPVISTEPLDAHSRYPRQGVIACRVVERMADAGGRERVVIDTEVPWGVAATSGETRFVVSHDQLVEL